MNMNARNDIRLESMGKEAEMIAEELKKDASVIAVILTGPLAMGVVMPNKLYFAVVTDADDGVIEHHFLDEGWAGVARPIEMGKFPLTVARHLIEHGYSDMVSYKSIEAFRCGEVLYEREGVGTELIEGSKRHIHDRAFIGESLHGAVSALDDAVALMKSGDHRNAVLVAREAVTKAVRMVMAGMPAAEDAPFLDSARRALTPELFERVRDVLGVRDIDPDTVRRHADRARKFAAHALREIGVQPEHILGPQNKG